MGDGTGRAAAAPPRKRPAPPRAPLTRKRTSRQTHVTAALRGMCGGPQRFCARPPGQAARAHPLIARGAGRAPLPSAPWREAGAIGRGRCPRGRGALPTPRERGEHESSGPGSPRLEVISAAEVPPPVARPARAAAFHRNAQRGVECWTAINGTDTESCVLD